MKSRPAMRALSSAALFARGWTCALAAFPANTFSEASTPAREVHELSLFVLLITSFIFVSVGGLLVYALIKYRGRKNDQNEPAQVFAPTIG